MENKFDPRAKVKQGDLGTALMVNNQISNLLILTLIKMHLESINLKIT